MATLVIELEHLLIECIGPRQVAVLGECTAGAQHREDDRNANSRQWR